MRPTPLGAGTLDPAALTEDRKACRRFGPCGVGRRALYLGTYLFDCRYYVPYSTVRRVFKRVAMSRGGFTGKGLFASIAYLVVVYDSGLERQCRFKSEQQVDELLAALRQTQPDIPCVSAAAESRLAEERARREAERLARPPLTDEAAAVLDGLCRAEDYLQQRPELSDSLSHAAKRLRAFRCSRGGYRQAATAITLLGLAALAYGIFALIRHDDFAVYFALFGLAAIFSFAGLSVLPTARNNRAAIEKADAAAQSAMADYLSAQPDFPLPARYAHPVVLRRMMRAVEDGRAHSVQEALSVVKDDLRALTSDVTVSQEEADEVTAVKPLFLNADYQ